MVKELDVRGLSCPLPVVKTKKALEEMESGELHVVIERAEGCQNVKRFAESQGCKVIVNESDGLFTIHIHKEQTSTSVSPKQSKDAVLITSDVLGTGDRQLGEILMKAFLNTLWDAEPRPARLLFLNDGVRLTTEGSDVLDSLRLLEDAGVEIFSCGTCLDYYQLKDKLKVGSVTNMYDTVDTLLSSAKVIKI
ncbi:MAG: sulfurtransferase-like selenium metabolism protein YedF [Dehalococcoidales bacterium]|nr:sulfurtransferase-like selenium metabolism protein YedF [Dehalococcoidales bacterium]